MKRRKILYVICLIGVFILNVFYVNYEFYVLMLMVILVPLFSFIIFLLAKNHLELYFRIPNGRVVQGERLRFQVKTVNQVPLLLSGSEIHFVIGCFNTTRKERRKLYMNTFFDKYSENVDMIAEHSGITEIRSDRVLMYDYFRIFGKTKEFRGITQIAVFPELLPESERYESEHIDGNELVNEQWTILSGDSDEIVDFREYGDGDSMNKIHWKLSVKADELIVKKFGDEDDRCIRILVDLSLTGDDDFRNHLDRIYQMAYSVGHYYVRCDVKASFIVWSEKESRLLELAFSNDDELDRAMITVMKQRCSVNAGSKTEAAFEESGLKMAEKPYWITARKQESRDYQVIDVKEDNLDEIMENLYGQQ